MTAGIVRRVTNLTAGWKCAVLRAGPQGQEVKEEQTRRRRPPDGYDRRHAGRSGGLCTRAESSC